MYIITQALKASNSYLVFRISADLQPIIALKESSNIFSRFTFISILFGTFT